MIDPILSLAVSVQANPGIYALLLGSGVSRDAQVPTGWEIVEDLARRLAVAEDPAFSGDPIEWYRTELGEEPSYSKVLEALTASPTERRGILRPYFEPTEEEREQGIKMPTQAHRSIAELAARGYIRIILTTNFDPLVESALEERGLRPTVIRTPDAIKGSLPLVHQQLCVIKLHGDYRDNRIRNTLDELGEYDEQTNALLDQVLDQFGLVVCGWSGQYDVALRAALERRQTRRFSWYWTARDEPGEEAMQLAALQDAQFIQIKDANSFFGSLSESVISIEESKGKPPTSTEMAVSLLKRYLPDPRHSVRLRELMMDESDAANQALTAFDQEILADKNTDNVPSWFKHYREIVETIQSLLVHGVSLGGEEKQAIWVSSLERSTLVGLPDRSARVSRVLAPGIRHYPITLLFYTVGIAAAADEDYDLLANLLLKTRLRTNRLEVVSMLTGIGWTDLSSIVAEKLYSETRHAPLSHHLNDVLRDPLRRYLPDQESYEEAFDRFEYLMALEYVNAANAPNAETLSGYFPIGNFGWKFADYNELPAGLEELNLEALSLCSEWPPLRAGLLNGNMDRFEDVRDHVRRRLTELHWS